MEATGPAVAEDRERYLRSRKRSDRDLLVDALAPPVGTKVGPPTTSGSHAALLRSEIQSEMSHASTLQANTMGCGLSGRTSSEYRNQHYLRTWQRERHVMAGFELSLLHQAFINSTGELKAEAPGPAQRWQGAAGRGWQDGTGAFKAGRKKLFPRQ
ncbi:hypothetical protein N656DRAFT_154466 [Canariomyces notabilis]|uniref:Uncharacterized protein n=1 Tax=Canariomyces notabilis TaxID=2074819 RepID=A0AAN6TBH5_9PEZI|nr:hypothetical protein N656DRAFT_154466 [Canariomyces arenarius]